jgi:hypothetical protein
MTHHVARSYVMTSAMLSHHAMYVTDHSQPSALVHARQALLEVINPDETFNSRTGPVVGGAAPCETLAVRFMMHAQSECALASSSIADRTHRLEIRHVCTSGLTQDTSTPESYQAQGWA